MEHQLNKILKLTFQSLQYAQEILEITEKMKEYIHRGSTDSLDSAIDERQKRMDLVNSASAATKETVEQLLRQFSIRSMEDIDKEAYPQVGSIINNQAKVKKIYSQTYDLEKTNCIHAEDLLKEYKDAIKGLHTSKKALQAYNRNGSGQSILLNRMK